MRGSFQSAGSFTSFEGISSLPFDTLRTNGSMVRYLFVWYFSPLPLKEHYGQSGIESSLRESYANGRATIIPSRGYFPCWDFHLPSISNSLWIVFRPAGRKTIHN